jgi:methyl-accepting chemotaxis protein
MNNIFKKLFKNTQSLNDSENISFKSSEFKNDFSGLQKIVSHAAIGAVKSQLRIKSNLKMIKQTSNTIEETINLASETKNKLEELANLSSNTSKEALLSNQFCHDGKVVVKNSLESSTELSHHMSVTFDRIDSLVKNVKNVSEISQTIQNVAFQTKLLAFNASVEAARAGEHGKGFSVVAQEIQKLGDSTAIETKTIMELLNKINQDLGPSIDALSKSKMLTEKTSENTKELNSFFEKISNLIQSSADQMQIISLLSSEQKNNMDQTYSRMLETKKDTLEVEKNTEELNLHSNDLSSIAEDAFSIFGKYNVGTFFNQTIDRAFEGCTLIQKSLEVLVNQKHCTIDQIIAHEYVEIKGHNKDKLSHLFDVSRVPHSGFIPPKYICTYDSLVDLEIQSICENILNLDSRYKLVLFVDLNCFAITHNKVFSKDWTGIHEQDLIGNRIKRFFDDSAVLLRASRVGLGTNLNLPTKVPYKTFKDKNCILTEDTSKSSPEFMVQTYTRDTGEVMSMVSMPVFVKSQRAGTLILGWID